MTTNTNPSTVAGSSDGSGNSKVTATTDASPRGLAKSPQRQVMFYAAIMAGFALLSSQHGDGEAYGFYSLLPALLILFVAVATKKPLESIFAGPLGESSVAAITSLLPEPSLDPATVEGFVLVVIINPVVIICLNHGCLGLGPATVILSPYPRPGRVQAPALAVGH